MTQLYNLAQSEKAHNNHINKHKLQESGTSLYNTQNTKCQILNLTWVSESLLQVPSEPGLCGDREAQRGEESKELALREIGVQTDRLRR